MKETIETNDQNVPKTEVNDQKDLTQEPHIQEITTEQDQQLTTGTTKPTGTSKDGTPMF